MILFKKCGVHFDWLLVPLSNFCFHCMKKHMIARGNGKRQVKKQKGLLQFEAIHLEIANEITFQ